MILGIGNDLVDIRRIESALEKHGQRFVDRCFSEAEKSDLERYAEEAEKVRISFLAKRFAAKEACVKALGTGFSRGITMQEICIERDELGKPNIVLFGMAQERLKKLSEGKDVHIHLSLTDEYPYALANVIIETF